MAAICGWLAWQVGRPVRGTALGPHARRIALAVGALLLVLAALPIVVPLFAPQPQDVTVQQIIDGDVSEPSGWVRLHGRVTPLSESPTGEPGHFGLLVDAANTFDAIVLRTDAQPAAVASTSVTGRLANAGAIVDEELPIEATVFGSPPQVVPDRVVDLDDVAVPERVVAWPLSILPALLGSTIVIGARQGYPIFRATTVIDVLTGPLGPGERLPAAYGGRIGPTVRDLGDPGAALLLVRRGPKGNLLTAQPLTDDGSVAPAPVTIGGSWTSGRIGEVYTVSETVAALVIRSELVDATFLFARTSERDRVAALIAVDR